MATKDKDEAAESFKDDLTLTVRDSQPLILTPEQVKNMTLDDMVSIWKVSPELFVMANIVHCNSLSDSHLHACVQEYVTELAGSLVETDKNPQDVVSAEKIKRLVNEAVSSVDPHLLHGSLHNHSTVLQTVLCWSYAGVKLVGVPKQLHIWCMNPDSSIQNNSHSFGQASEAFPVFADHTMYACGHQ